MGNQIGALRRRDRRGTSATTDAAAHVRRLKIVLLGTSGVGKTTLFRRLLDQSPLEKHAPTTSVNIGAKLIQLDGQPPVLVELWDVPDQVYAGKSIFETYLQSLDGALLVYDVASTSSWRTVVDYHALLSAHANASCATEPQPPPAIAVVGNKVDTLPTAAISEAMQQAHEWAIHQQHEYSSTHIHHATVSATRALHTLELLRAVVDAIVHDGIETKVAISTV